VDLQAALRVAVLEWGAARRRDLPWRRTRDPWAVLVSEFMLQQTQVSRVVPRYSEFLARFPTPAVCAAAPLAEVVRHWDGLGYNRRAVSLHRAATAIAHDGFPSTIAGLRALPGVGPYTARAVLAYAYEIDAAVVDTNVARVLARFAGRPLSPAEAQAMADDWLAPGQAWAWNQAMMDLGAERCRSRNPRCDCCPVVSACSWARAGRPAPDPAIGSAHVSTRQAPFAGSDRQARGRLVRALRHGPVAVDDAPSERVISGLIRDGLIRREGLYLYLA
jgi:A/G-specific adenine glycosylase